MARRLRQQPHAGPYPALRPEFGGAILVYLPSISILHGDPWNANIITGTPTQVTPGPPYQFGTVVARHSNSGIRFPGTQTIDFSGTGISILAVGDMVSNSGTEINSLICRDDNSAAGGFEVDVYNKFAGASKNRIYGGYNKAGVDTNWDRGYVNGVADSLNGSFTTANATRYVIACSADSGPGGGASLDIDSGRASASNSAVDVELVIIWKRALSAQQLRNLSVDPYYVFAPQRSFVAMAEPAGSSVSAALTGVAGTGAVGTVAPSTSKALTGNAGTGSPGTVAPSTAGALTGNAATAAVGSVTPVRSGAITGAAATGALGTVAPSASKALTGNAVTGSVGSVTPVLMGALTGNAGTGAAGTVVPQVAIALTGVAANGQAGTVTAVVGGGAVSAALTGVQATGGVGTVSPVLDKALTGNAASGAAGTVSPQASKVLTGTAGTGAAGTVSSSVTVALTGVSATGAVGTVSAGADATQALTGVSATGAVGTVTPNLSIALTGVSATGAVGSVTAGQPLTGVAGTGAAGNVGPGTSKALTGTAAASAVGSVGQEVSIGLTGVQATGDVGSVAFVGGDLTIALTGVQATGQTGVLQVAGTFSDIAEAVWSYMLSNGKTAGQNVVEIRSLLDTLTPGFWDFVIEGTFTAADLLRVIAAVQAGKSSITPLGAGAATVEFRAVDDSEVRVTADMQGSERTEVTLNAN